MPIGKGQPGQLADILVPKLLFAALEWYWRINVACRNSMFTFYKRVRDYGPMTTVTFTFSQACRLWFPATSGHLKQCHLYNIFSKRSFVHGQWSCRVFKIF